MGGRGHSGGSLKDCAQFLRGLLKIYWDSLFFPWFPAGRQGGGKVDINFERLSRASYLDG